MSRRYIVPPCRGEFGLKIRYHVPQVHALASHPDAEVVVFHEPGEEALFPAASERHVVEPIPDDDRRGMWPRTDREVASRIASSSVQKLPGEPLPRFYWTGKGKPEKRFVPEPVDPPAIEEAPLVICPRWRRYGAGKNWNGWKLLAQELGPIAVAAGTSEASEAIVGCRDVTWRFDRERVLDATIQAMRNAELVIATDAGLAHLAMLVGVDLVLVTYRGLVAPGPVRGTKGEILEPSYWPVRVEEYYERANHQGAKIHVSDSWEHPERLVEFVKRRLG